MKLSLRQKSAPAWAFVIGLLSILYVLAEYGFNALMVDVASSVDLESGSLDRVALIGETLSGIGLAFLIINVVEYLSKLSVRTGAWVNLILFLGLLAVTIPLMRWAQPALINHFVDQSDAADRSRALSMNLFKYAAGNGAIVFGQTTVGSSVPDKVLLALLGPLAVNNDGVHASLQANKNQIMNRLVLQSAKVNGERRWEQYLGIRNGVSASYNDFLGSVDRFDKEMGRTSGKSDGAIKQIRDESERAFDQYQRKEQSLQSETEARRKRVYELISSVGRDASRCESHSCVVRASDRYSSGMKSIYGFTPPQSDFVTQREATASDAISKRGSSYNLNLASLVMNTVSNQSITEVSSSSVARGDEKYQAELFKNKIGHPAGLSLQAFKREPDICLDGVKRVRSKGINVPANWCPDDENAVREAIDGKRQDKVQEEWDRRTKQRFGVVVSPDVSEEDFRRLTSIQRSIEQRLVSVPCAGGNGYLTAAQFKARCIDPELSKQRKKLTDTFSAPLAELADGREYADQGRNAVRALLVPPIAIIFSLAFSLLALVKFVGPWPLKLALVVAIATAPSLLPANHSEIADFLLNSEGQQGAVLRWSLNLEPWAYQFGSMFKSAFAF